MYKIGVDGFTRTGRLPAGVQFRLKLDRYNPRMLLSDGRLRPTLWLALPILAAVFLVLPLMIWGYPVADDLAFHVHTWQSAAFAMRHGALFPGWAALANFRFGEPRFIFYPPLSWLLGGALSFILPWRLVPGAFAWVALTGAGLAMYRFAVGWFPRRSALFAGLAYMMLPYEALLVHARWAAGELLVSALFPLLLLAALRLADGSRSALAGCAALYAAVWLTDLPGAVIASYSLALVFLVVALKTRSLQPLMLGAAGLSLGLALAAFFVLPAAWEQRWVRIDYALMFGIPFLKLWSATRPKFNAALVFSVIVGLAPAIYAGIRRKKIPRVCLPLAVLAAAAAFLTIPLSNPLWQHLPKLRFVQFPFRWILVEDAAAAFLCAAVFGALRPKARVAMAAFVITLFAATMATVCAKHGEPGGTQNLVARADKDGYIAVPEYLPKGAVFRHNPGGPTFASASGPSKLAFASAWRGDTFAVDATVSEPGELSLPVNWYPAWRAEVNGAAVPVGDKEGLICVPLARGANRVVIRFAATPDRLLGAIISLLALIVLAAAALMFRGKHGSIHLPFSGVGGLR